MRTWRISRRELLYTLGGVVLMLAIAVYVAGNPEALPLVRVAIAALAAWNIWELVLGPVYRVTVDEDGRVELKTPLRTASIGPGEIVRVGKRAGDRRGRGPFVLTTAKGRWRVHRKLEPDVSELVDALREHNPDLVVEI